MAAMEAVEKEITLYLPRLSAKQKEVVLSLVKTFADEDERWDNEAYTNEMNRRFAELEKDEVESITLEEAEAGARERYKMRKAKGK